MPDHRAPPAHVAPPDVSQRLPRPRLLEQLNALVAPPSVRALWLGAPSGGGKTTAAAAYAGTRSAVVWLRVDDSDADPAAFSEHMRDALAHARGTRAGMMLPAATREQLARPALMLRSMMRSLAACLPDACLLVMDDLQCLADDTVATLIGPLVSELRQGQALLALSQRDPPVALARLVAAGCLARLDSRALAFDADEVSAWLDRVSPGADSAGLMSLSGGWPAAVTLLPQSLGEQKVRDLIESTVWPALDARAQEALERCAWLPFLTADDADPALLDGLARAAWLVDRCGDDPPRWRLHELLSDFVRARQRRLLSATQLATRMLDAAHRAEQRGDVDTALALHQGAADRDETLWGDVDAMLCRAAPGWLAACRHASLRQAVQRIPPGRRSGELCWRMAQAESLYSPSSGRAWADEALQRLPDEAVAFKVQCHTLAIASHFQAFDDTRPLAARVASLEALGVTAADSAVPSDQRAAVAVAVWSALFLRLPSHPSCADWQAKVRSTLHERVDANLKLRAAMLLAKQGWYTGRYDDVMPLPSLVESELQRQEVTPYSRLLWGLMRQYAAWAAADWATGRAATREALAEAQSAGIPLLDQHLRLHGACFESLLGDEAAAQSLLDRVGEQADAARHMETWHHFTVRAWIELRRGQPANADAAAGIAIEAALAMGPAPHAMSLAIRCHARQVLGEAAGYQVARKELDALWRPGANPLAMFHGLILDARHAHDLGDRPGTAARLARALALAQRHGLWSPFGCEPRSLARMLGLALEGGIEPIVAERMARAMRLPPPPGAGSSWAWPVRVHTLGRFGIDIDGVPAMMSGKQQKRPLDLLQALIALGGEAPASRLSDLLWPDAEGDRAMDSFEAALRRLRQQLGRAEALELSGGQLRINRQLVWVDALAGGATVTSSDFLPDQDAAWAHAARERRAIRLVASR